MDYWAMLALAVGFGLPVAVLSAALSQGKVGGAALEGMARQPEASGDIRVGMILSLAFIESLIIYALVMFFMLAGKLPSVAEATKAIEAIAKGGG